MGDFILNKLLDSDLRGMSERNTPKGVSDGSTEGISKAKVKPSDKLISDIASYGFEMDQIKEVLKVKGNQLIISCAGSGKTTTMIFKILYDLKSGRSTRLIDVNNNSVRVPDKIWVCTFLKTGADELESSLIKWSRKLNCPDVSKAISFSTLHAEFKRSLLALGVDYTIISDKDNMSLLKKVIEPLGLVSAEGKNLNSEDYQNLVSALSYTRNRLDGKRYLRNIYDDLNITKPIVDAILSNWKKERHAKKMVDFEDLQEILYNACYKENNEEVINYLSNRYSFIYIDEAQDISQIQYALLKIYGSRAKQVVAIGDDDQTIYSWRGSFNGIITKEFSEDFMPTRSDLSVNFRCPENILNAVLPSISKNTSRFPKSIKAFNKGGILRYGEFSSYKLMLQKLGDLVYDDILKGMNVAILCRVNSDGLMPALIFDRLDKFSYSISGDGMTLDSYIGRMVINILKLFTEKYSNAVKSSLNMLTYKGYSVNSLLRVCANNKLSFWDIDVADLSYSCPDIANILISWRRYRENSGDVEALRYVLEFYRTSVFVKDTQFNSVVRSVITSVESLLDYYDYDTVDDFLYELYDINDRLKARKRVLRNVKVRIATVHEFKGKEADSVYIWNDSENTFPHSKCDLDDLEEVEEERRVHYIACTRATKISTIMSRKGSVGSFVKEMDLSKAENIGVVKTSVEGVVEKKHEEDSNLNKFMKECMSNESDVSDGVEGKYKYTGELNGRKDASEETEGSNSVDNKSGSDEDGVGKLDTSTWDGCEYAYGVGSEPKYEDASTAVDNEGTTAKSDDMGTDSSKSNTCSNSINMYENIFPDEDDLI